MRSCRWKRVKFKTTSLSEWTCETCGETGYSTHEKAPSNCLVNITGKGYQLNTTPLSFSNASAFFKRYTGLVFAFVGFSLLISGTYGLQNSTIEYLGFILVAIGLIYHFFPKEKSRKLFYVCDGERLPWYKLLLFISTGAMPYAVIFVIFVIGGLLAFLTR